MKLEGDVPKHAFFENSLCFARSRPAEPADDPRAPSGMVQLKSPPPPPHASVGFVALIEQDASMVLEELEEVSGVDLGMLKLQDPLLVGGIVVLFLLIALIAFFCCCGCCKKSSTPTSIVSANQMAHKRLIEEDEAAIKREAAATADRLRKLEAEAEMQRRAMATAHAAAENAKVAHRAALQAFADAKSKAKEEYSRALEEAGAIYRQDFLVDPEAAVLVNQDAQRVASAVYAQALRDVERDVQAAAKHLFEVTAPYRAYQEAQEALKEQYKAESRAAMLARVAKIEQEQQEMQRLEAVKRQNAIIKAARERKQAEDLLLADESGRAATKMAIKPPLPRSSTSAHSHVYRCVARTSGVPPESALMASDRHGSPLTSPHLTAPLPTPRVIAASSHRTSPAPRVIAASSHRTSPHSSRDCSLISPHLSPLLA